MSLVLNLKKCFHCDRYFKRASHRNAHSRICSLNPTKPTANTNASSSVEGEKISLENVKIKEIESFRGAGKLFRLPLKDVEQSPKNILDVAKDGVDKILTVLSDELEQTHSVKIHMSVIASFHQMVETQIVTQPSPCLSMKTETVHEFNKLDSISKHQFDEMVKQIDAYESRGSGWVLRQLENIDLSVVHYQPIPIGTYVKTPKFLSDKKAIVNVENSDNKCFLYSVLVGLYYNNTSREEISKRTPYRVSMWKNREHTVNTSRLQYPVQVNDISKFEKDNSNISISVYCYDQIERSIYPVKVSSQMRRDHVNLLILKGKNNGYHYCTITNLDRLLKKGSHTKLHCRFCLQGFDTRSNTPNDVKVHEMECNDVLKGCPKLEFPDETHIEYKNYSKQLRHRYTVYADFESLLVKDERVKNNRQVLQRHEIMSYCYIIHSSIPSEKFPPKTYTGPNAAEHFLDAVNEDLETIIQPNIEVINKMIWNEEAKNTFEKAKQCWICEKPLRRGEEIIVRHHQHSTGEFVGAAHNLCNLQLKQPKKRYTLPVVFHNGSNYDWHHIFRAVQKRHGSIRCIAKTMEKYISVQIGKLLFRDSAMLMAHESLDGMAKTLKEEDFKILKRIFPQNYHLLMGKLPNAYDYFTSWEVLQETQLPSIEHFFNKLTSTACTEQDYQRAQEIWNTFHCKTLQDFYTVYLKVDVLLLADICTHLKDTLYDKFGLEVMEYATLPGFSWDAMLKKTGVQLEIVKDPNMLLMIQKGIRGGTSMIGTRHARVNQPHRQDYNPNDPLCLLDLVDANSLYPHIMQMLLPIDGFKWMNEMELDMVKSLDYLDDGPKGHIIEVDLEYPRSLHDENAHKNFPLAVESLEISQDMWSEYQKQTYPKKSGKSTKLVPNLFDKKRYVIHSKVLKLYVQLGLRITKIHRGISFNQSAWLAPFIEDNINWRIFAKKMGLDSLEKYAKLLNNSVVS